MPMLKGATKARKPSALKRLEGTEKSERVNKREPACKSGAPRKPGCFSGIESRIWDDLVSVLLDDMHVLTVDDGSALYCLTTALAHIERLDQALRDLPELHHEEVRTDKAGNETVTLKIRPELAARRAAGAEAASLMARFGMTPADRARVNSSGPKDPEAPQDPTDEFAG